MFTCRSCLHRHLRALITSNSASEAWPKVALQPRRDFQSSQSYTGAGATTSVRDVSKSRTNRPKNTSIRRTSQSSPIRNHDSFTKTTSNATAVSSPNITDEAEAQRRLEKQLRTELKYISDPLKLANRVAQLLEKDEEKRALALCRLSSRAMANVVSWNHIIDYLLKKAKTAVALKTYSEMRKRAIKPDSYTFLLLLRGLGENAHLSQSLSRALSIYHSMSGERSHVKPTIKHSNAMLKVCARANDIDSMWDIVSKLPERGPHAADSWTFSIILNSLQMNFEQNLPDQMTEQERQKRCLKIISEGRKLWAVVIEKWRNDEFVIDEKLVSAMGRLLLMSNRPRDLDDVFSLVHQTMDIPRIIPRYGTQGRPSPSISKRQGNLESKDTSEDTQSDSLLVTGESSVSCPYLDAPPGSKYDVFNANSPDTHNSLASHRKGPNSATKTNVTGVWKMKFARPGPNILSVILESCLKQRMKQPALDYWTKLTTATPKSPGDQSTPLILPDQNDLVLLMRVIKQAHASASALRILQQTVEVHDLEPSTKALRLAMSTCLADNHNAHAFETASRIIDLCAKTQDEHDVETLHMYLTAADILIRNLTEKRFDPKSLPALFPASTIKRACEGNVISTRIYLVLLNHLAPCLRELKLRFNFTIVADGSLRATYNSARLLFRRVISVYDRLLRLPDSARPLMSRSQRDTIYTEKATLDAYLKRTKERASRFVTMPASATGGAAAEDLERKKERQRRVDPDMRRGKAFLVTKKLDVDLGKGGDKDALHLTNDAEIDRVFEFDGDDNGVGLATKQGRRRRLRAG